MAHAETFALVTGGTQGLGYAVAEELIAQGCRKLVITTQGANLASDAVAALSAKGAEVHALSVELAEIDQVRRLVPDAVAAMGDLNVLVNCAANTERGSILDTSEDHWDKIQTINAKAPFFLLQDFANHCIAAGHPGACVNILSIVIYGGLPFLAPYVASKAALGGVTKNAAAALARHRIRVNGINVGWMDTPGEDVRQRESHDRPEGWLAAAEANMPFGMLVKPAHVARQVAFLTGPDSGVVTGSLIDFDQQVVGAYPDTNES